MKHHWQIQEAKNRFSELLEDAETQGPQIVTRHGAEKAVVLSIADYRRLQEPAGSLVDFFRRSPLSGLVLDFEDRADLGREIEG
jgi:antitoxin Phd